MSALLVDTSSWISYFKGDAHPAIDEALVEMRLYISPVIVAELMSRKLSASKRRELESFLKDLPLTTADFDHWVRVGQLRADLLSKGISISTADAHIAQTALDLKAVLLSEDLIFTKLKAHSKLRLVSDE